MLLPAQIRAATSDDADTVSRIYLASRKYFLPYAPLAHTDEGVRVWIANHLFINTNVIVAIVETEIVGFESLSHGERAGWIEQLYLHPNVVGQGIGTQFIQQAKIKLGAPIRLYTFQANSGARRFYEQHGFKAIEFGDGSQNEEKCPDVLYEWRG